MKKILIYTDGACPGNPGPGGWGAILRLVGTDYWKELAGGYRLTTNNRMELIAAIEALAALREPCQVELYTDSQYLSNAVAKGWLENWRKKNFIKRNNKPVPNKDLWEKLFGLLSLHQVRFKWIRGHAGYPENERCDELARAFAARDNLLADIAYENLLSGMGSEAAKGLLD